MLTIASLFNPVISVVLIICISIKKWKDVNHEKIKSYSILVGFLFGFLGYCLAFNHNANDLSRYYDTINNLKGLPLSEIIKLDSEKLYVQDLIYFFVSKTGNEHILGFLSGFIVYTISSYILFDTINRSNRKFKTYEILMLFIISIGMISPYIIIANVRCVIAYSIICLAIYRELVQNKKNLFTLFLYIFPIGIHSSAIIIIGIRIISSLLKAFKSLSLAIIILLPEMINFAHSYFANIGFGTLGQLISRTIDKAYYYLYWNEGGWASQVQRFFSNTFTRVTGTIFLCLILIILFYYNKKDRNENNEKKLIDLPIISFIYFSSIFALGCLAIKTGAFWRFEMITMILSPILFSKIIEKNERTKSLINVFFVFALFVLSANLISMIRNIHFLETMTNMLTTSGIKIVYEILKGVIEII